MSTKTDTSEIILNTNPLNYLEHNFKYPFPKINSKYTSSNEINRIIKSLQPKNSSGYDSIPLKMLKISVPFIIFPLTCICNKSLSLGIFPERLKYFIVEPVFKEGHRAVISSYRPVSLLTSFSKIFKKLIYAILYDHLNQHNIMAPEQYGEKASFSLVHEILLAMNSSNTVGGLFCDLQRAFDCVNYNMLFKKLKFCGL